MWQLWVFVFAYFSHQYKFRDVAVEELQKIHRIFPGMQPLPGTYSEFPLENTYNTFYSRFHHLIHHIDMLAQLLIISLSAFNDSTQKDLLKLDGNIPVQYEGETV